MPECFLHYIQQKIETKYHEQKAKPNCCSERKRLIMNDRVSETGPAALNICREGFPTFSGQCNVTCTPNFFSTSINFAYLFFFLTERRVSLPVCFR